MSDDKRENNLNEKPYDLQLKEFENKPISVYESGIAFIDKIQSEFQGNITYYYIFTLKSVKIGLRLKKKSDFRKEQIKNVENLRVRIAEKIFNDMNLFIGDKVNFNGKLVEDNRGYIVKNVRKVTKIPKDQVDSLQYHEEKRREAEKREKRLELIILKSLQDFAERFPRIHLEELVKKVGENEKKLIEIIERLIENKKLPAVFDHDSKGIEFHTIGADIEKLFETFDNWSEGEKELDNWSEGEKEKKI